MPLPSPLTLFVGRAVFSDINAEGLFGAAQCALGDTVLFCRFLDVVRTNRPVAQERFEEVVVVVYLARRLRLRCSSQRVGGGDVDGVRVPHDVRRANRLPRLFVGADLTLGEAKSKSLLLRRRQVVFAFDEELSEIVRGATRTIVDTNSE